MNWEHSTYSRLVLVSLVSTLGAPVALAADAPSLPRGATVIHLVERAERLLPRDEIVAALRVEATGNTPLDVQSEVNRRMAVALDQAKRAPAIKIETPSMNVYSSRNSNVSSSGNSKDSTVAWTATESLALRSKDIAAALGLVGTLESQQLAVTSLAFTVSPEVLAGVQDPLTAEALQRLRARADAVAGDLGLVVDHLQTVTIGNAEPPGVQPAMLRARASAEFAPPAAEPGETAVSVIVDADVVLVRKH
jgi:uncharacterized protein